MWTFNVYSLLSEGQVAEQKEKCERVRWQNSMRKSCPFSVSLFLTASVSHMHMCAHTRAHTHGFFICHGDGEDRAEREAVEKVIEMLKTRSGHETLFAVCIMKLSSFFPQLIFVYVICSGCCSVTCLGKQRNNLPFLRTFVERVPESWERSLNPHFCSSVVTSTRL